MRIIRHRLGNRMRGALMVILTALLIGLIPLQAAYAASLEESFSYRQIWTNRSGENVDNTFEYRLTSKGGSPLPNEATGDYYSLTAKGNESGSIKLHFPFYSPGYYHYNVQAHIPQSKADYAYDDTVYDVMIMVVNSESGLTVGAATIQIEGSEDKSKYDELTFSQSYTKEPEDGDSTTDNDPGGGGNNPGGVNASDDGDNPGVTGTVNDGDGGNELPTDIDDIKTPKTLIPDVEHWALLNLILMALAVVIASADALLYFKDPKDKYGEDYENREIRRHGLTRIIALIPAAVSVLVFLLTENMSEPMEWVDQYTIWMLILFVATTVITMMSKKEIGKENGEGGDPEPV